jgi:putative nucleotidyltransferase with HDIG domain
VVRAHHLIHLAKRFFGSLWPGGPPPADEAWVSSILRPGEVDLWRRMSGADRRHAVGVARAVGSDDRTVTAAALLHDVGKIDAGIGTFRRAAVTAATLVVGRERVVRARPGGTASRYLRHDEIGAGLLRDAGADELTVTWAREHHLPEKSWTVPADIGRRLKAADDD